MTRSRNLMIKITYLLSFLIGFFIFEKFKNTIITSDYLKINNENTKDVMIFWKYLNSSERKVYSQNKEDGVVDGIFDSLYIKDLKKVYVEIGTSNGDECNTRYLREKKQWSGFLFDQAHSKPEINLHKELIHHNNALDILNKYNIPIDIDLLSVDTDFADYWITEKILTKYKPKVVIHEINQQSPDKCVSVPKIDEIVIHDGSNFHGANICAFYCLAISNDYSMVYCESTGINCFWIKNDLIQNNLKFDINNLQKLLNPDFLYRNAALTQTEETDKKWFDIQKCF